MRRERRKTAAEEADTLRRKTQRHGTHTDFIRRFAFEPEQPQRILGDIDSPDDRGGGSAHIVAIGDIRTDHLFCGS